MIRTEMRSGTHRLLHIGGSAANASIIRGALAGSSGVIYDLQWVEGVPEAVDLLVNPSISAVIFDLPGGDRAGLEALEHVTHAAPHLPVIVVGGVDSEHVAKLVIHAGACDYLLTKHIDSYWLPHAIRHAIEQKMADDAFEGESDRFKITLNSIGEAMVSTDADGRIIYMNSLAEGMTGWSRVEAVGEPLEDVLRIVDRVSRELVVDVSGPTAAPNNAVPPPERALVQRDGSEIAVEYSALGTHDREGVRTGTVIVLRDVSAARAMSVRMSHLASHDPLTDLPNRLLLSDRLERALAMAHRYHRRLAVLYLDIDHFKYINDSLGHQLGDELLRIVAREITLCVRSSDTVSRIGGDEFVVVLAELERAEDAAIGARKIIAALARPHALAGHELHITVSVGISVFPSDGSDVETLLKSADMALYQAKGRGRDCFQFFEPHLAKRAVERRSIEAGLHGALDRREFELLYQPKLNLKSGAVVGAEALIRWRHPDRGLVEPAQFVPIAEECGLIKPIGQWVVHEACRQARAWQDAGLRPVTVSVNISGLEFRSKGFVDKIGAILEDTGLDARYLEIEVTESVLMADVESTNAMLHALKRLGVHLAIDDFGTGWSSLSYLRQFPIDVLKIDRSFVKEITSRESVAPIVSAVISMSKRLKLRVIAEGVETSEQLAFLQAEECDEGQGYYFSRPVDADELARALAPVRLLF